MAETLTVTVDDGGTYTVDVRGVALFTDTGLATPATFPASISAQTTWYAAAPAKHGPRANIEVLVTASDGSRVPVPTFNSLPATVSASEGGAPDFSGPATAASSAVQKLNISTGVQAPVTVAAGTTVPFLSPLLASDGVSGATGLPAGWGLVGTTEVTDITGPAGTYLIYMWIVCSGGTGGKRRVVVPGNAEGGTMFSLDPGDPVLAGGFAIGPGFSIVAADGDSVVGDFSGALTNTDSVDVTVTWVELDIYRISPNF